MDMYVVAVKVAVERHSTITNGGPLLHFLQRHPLHGAARRRRQEALKEDL